jgi:hypothetical protein
MSIYNNEKRMTKFAVASLAAFVLLLLGTAASAQDLGELSADYSYVHYAPRNGVGSINLNGGGGAGVLYFAGVFGIKAEIEGYAGNTVSFAFPPGSVRCPAGCSGTAQANLLTFNAGPTIKFRIHRFQPFVEALVGATHTDFYRNVARNCVGCVFPNFPGDYAFDLVLGGGIDIKVSHHFAIRPVEADYLLTRFINNLTTGSNNQSNFRYQAGIVFMF